MSWDFELIDGPYGGVTEGPVWDGSGVLFTHIPQSKILRFDPKKGSSTVFRENTNQANGLARTKDGVIFACEGDARRVVLYKGSSAPTEVLIDSFEGKSFNVPNDLAIDNNGNIWFTDPFYEGAAGTWSEDLTHKELDHDSVYFLKNDKEKSEWIVKRATYDTTRPNGILFSLDYKTLYVAQSGRRDDEKRELRAYDVNDDNTLGSFKVLHDFGANRGVDGMAIDKTGCIIATAGWFAGGPGPSIYVFSPSGEVIERHPLIYDRPTNCVFGGDDMNTLFVTTIDGHLLKAETDRIGVEYNRN